MKKEYNIYVEMTEENISKYYNNIIRYCCSISNKVTFAVNLAFYDLSKSEIPDAYDDFLKEYDTEEKERQTMFRTDAVYRKSLLAKYQSEEEVYEFLKRLRTYDMITLEEAKKNLLEYLHRSKSIKPPTANLVLPQDSFLETHFTWKSHCTIGGLYKVLHFQMNQSMIDRLSNVKDINEFYTFSNVYFLEDPGFYVNEKIKCSICSHEKTCALFLDEEEYKKFTLLDIPYVIDELVHS